MENNVRLKSISQIAISLIHDIYDNNPGDYNLTDKVEDFVVGILELKYNGYEFDFNKDGDRVLWRARDSFVSEWSQFYNCPSKAVKELKGEK